MDLLSVRSEVPAKPYALSIWCGETVGWGVSASKVMS